MAIARDSRYLAAALVAGLALSHSATAPAQTTPSGPGISSGSGAGTGTGGVGPGSTGTGTSGSMTPSGTAAPARPGDGPVPRTGPGPGEPAGPIETLRDVEAGRPIYGLELSEEQLRVLDSRLLNEARAITRPEERALALVGVARSKVFGREYAAAHTALVEASQAALKVPPGLVRDLRIRAVVKEGFLRLAEARSSEGSAKNIFTSEDEPLPPESLETWTRAMKGAQEEWNLAADLAARIDRRPYRSLTLFEVVESQSSDLVRRGAFLDEFEGQVAEELKAVEAGKIKAALGLIDAGLDQGLAHARRIDLPLWRDRALATVVSGAAGARRFDRGFAVARAIPRPDARADALLRLAETEARRGTPKGATRAYTEALQAIAAIPVTDLRSILTGVLIDSLIASGRFEDARAAVVLYSDPARRLQALGAVAESQGRRGLSESAKVWIAKDASPDVRSQLYRRLNDGILASLEQYRTNEYSVNPAR